MTNEDATGVINNVVDSLRNNPLVIGLLVLNAVFIMSGSYLQSSRSEATKEVILEIMRECRQVRQYAPQNQVFPLPRSQIKWLPTTTLASSRNVGTRK